MKSPLADPGKTSSSTYRNPILDADWPDPDVVRHGEDYYMVASSFNRAPGLPILHSTDLVNWELVAHALPAVTPLAHHALPRHGGGVWAPSIRHHDGVFHIVYPDPDQGILVVSASDPRGTWSEPRVLLAGLGIIDPCPLWDDDGRAYLVHGWARSRAGVKNRLNVVPVDVGLTSTLDSSRTVIDGDLLPGYRTLEGPKFSKRDGWYWIFAPAGGVADGWQSVFRSRNVYGPYEDRIVLQQGDSPVNGPHQGAWVNAADGSDWFFHFQDRGVYGRVVHLQPMRWTEDGWPVIGTPREAETWGEPVTTHPSPKGTAQERRTLSAGDDFEAGPGKHWYWQGNPADGWWSTPEPKILELSAIANDSGNLRLLPQFLGQQLPGMAVDIETTVSVQGRPGTRAGLAVLGRDYCWVGVEKTELGTDAVVRTRRDADQEETETYRRQLGSHESTVTIGLVSDTSATVTAVVASGADRLEISTGFTATAGHWIGAEIGLFAASPLGCPHAGTASFGPVALEIRDEH